MNIVARFVAFLLAAALPLEETSAKTRAGQAGGMSIENSEWVDTDPQAAWKAFVEDVGRWWPADFTQGGDPSALSMEAMAGGGVHEDDGGRHACQMTIVSVVPGRSMRTRADLAPLQGLGLRGALEWSFAEENGGTRITLRYSAGDYSADDIGEFAQLVEDVQATQLAGLAAYLGRGAHGA